MTPTNHWTLITGASSGIGRELAELFAADHIPLVLVARNEARLERAAAELRAKYEIPVRPLAVNLAEPAAAQKIFDALRDTPVSTLVNNAGVGFHGPFAETRLSAHREILQVNLSALVELTHLFLPPMLARREGRVLNVASTAAFQPGPWVAVYYASKAFVHSFSCALAEELEGTGVQVGTLCPGTTDTPFFERGGFGGQRAPFTMEARSVAQAGYRGFKSGRRTIIPGAVNRLAAILVRLVPTRLAAKAAGRYNRKRSPDSR